METFAKVSFDSFQPWFWPQICLKYISQICQKPLLFTLRLFFFFKTKFQNLPGRCYFFAFFFFFFLKQNSKISQDGAIFLLFFFFFCSSQQWLWPTNHINFSFFIRIIKYCLKYFACESCVFINISWMKSGKTVVNCYVCPKKHLFWVGKCALKDHVYKQGKTMLKVLIENLISF